MRLIFWGTGTGSIHAVEYISDYVEMANIEILAYVDNNSDMWGKCFNGKKVVSPKEICEYEYDYIVIASVKHPIIKKQCVEDLQLPIDKILSSEELCRKLYALHQYKKRYKEEKKKENADVGKIVVYTANFGGYDDLQDPLYVDENIKYICFTDNKDFCSSVWDVRYIDTSEGEALPLMVRYYKFFPYKLFPDYEVSVWVDSKYQIIGDLREYIKKYQKDQPMLCFPHFFRDCIYDEAVECIRLGKGNPIMLGGQIYHYFMDGYPANNGLYEGGCLVRWHHDDKLQKVMQAWWDEIHQYSWRDQVSLPYVCWKNDFMIDISDLDIVHNYYLEELGHISN
ncbi:MAG: DUF616 domain-containing protein [Lachnospiraceae bacterium]|nr:DUF616 domain-containing protein [Lachnospiraceae bacterium]